MKLFTAVSTLVTLACSPAPSARAEFDTIYTQRSEWVQSRNVTALLAQMAPDYFIRLSDGNRMSRSQIEERWKYYYDKVLIRHIRFANVIQRVETHADSATVTFEQQDHRMQNGPNGPMEVEANVVHDEVWLRRPEGCQLLWTTEGKQTKLMIDGKPSP